MVALFIFVVATTPAVAFALAYLALFEEAAPSTERGGVWYRKVLVGESPYRAGDSWQELPPVAPPWVRLACGLSASGGVAALFLVPLVLIFMLAFAREGWLICQPVFFVCAAGIPAAVLVVRVAREVARHDAVHAPVFPALYVHHACVAATMSLIGHVQTPLFGIAVFLVLSGPLAIVHFASKIPVAGQRPAARSTLGERDVLVLSEP